MLLGRPFYSVKQQKYIVRILKEQFHIWSAFFVRNNRITEFLAPALFVRLCVFTHVIPMCSPTPLRTTFTRTSFIFFVLNEYEFSKSRTFVLRYFMRIFFCLKREKPDWLVRWKWLHTNQSQRHFEFYGRCLPSPCLLSPPLTIRSEKISLQAHFKTMTFRP